MSTRALGWTALLLGLALGAVVPLLAERLGWLGAVPSAPPGFTFENPLLTAPYGRRVVLRPMQAGLPSQRYWFGPIIADPEPGDELYPAPHVRLGVEERENDRAPWSFKRVGMLALGQMGALTVKEWLEEVRPVRERTREGGERIVLRVSFGHESGALVVYFFDPRRPVPGLGWFRSEHRAPERPPVVHFAYPAPPSN